MFWEFILIYTALVLLTSVLLGSVLSSVYLRSIHRRSCSITQSQADHAVDDLNAQLDTMRTLSLKLSVNRTFTPEFFQQSKSSEIALLDSLAQYQSYLSLADEFVLLYRHEGGRISAFKSDGTKTDLDVYFGRYGVGCDDALLSFLFECGKQGEFMACADCFLFAWPLQRSAHSAIDAALCFIVKPAALDDRIELTSDIQPGSYTLAWRGQTLVQTNADGTRIHAGTQSGFFLDVAVPDILLSDLLSDVTDVALFCICIAVLLICVVLLAYRCYRPIRSLMHKYAGDESSRGILSNELAALDRTIEQLQTRSQQLDRQAAGRTAQLRNYVLLMLLNNVSTTSRLVSFESTGLRFDLPLFCVLAIMPCAGQIVSPDSMDVVISSMNDVAEDVGALYAVECDPSTHTVAALCNVETPEDMDVLLQRMRTYLGCQSLRFSLGAGTLAESIAGVSSSYLSALNHLEMNSNAQEEPSPAAQNADRSENAVLLRRMLGKIESADCPGALLDLDAYMSRQGAETSELMRRYNLFSLKCAVRQLCDKVGYALSAEQISILLTMGDVHSAHCALRQLIPEMCAHAQKLSSRTVVPAANLVMEYLRAHFCEYDISAQRIAEAVGIGINRTNAIIKEETGLTCKACITHLRIERAKKLLLETDVSVSDLCGQVGYNSPSHFIKVFRTAVGQTPDGFRHGREEEPLPPPPPKNSTDADA